MEKSYTEETKENGENKDKTYVKKCTTKASFCRLAFLGCIVITPAITPGMATSYSAIALRQLDLDLNKASWFASIMSLATPFGNLFTGFILDRCGRRISLILSILPSIIGWFLLSLENASVFTLYMGRILTGFALGAASLPSTVYLAECITINNLKLRGSLSTWTTLALSIGVLITYALGALVRYNEVAFTAFILSIASLLLILVFIPESPVWLYRRGRIGDALLAEARLGIAQPILQVKRSETISESTYDVETEFSIRSLIDFANKIKRKDVYKPFIITTSFLFFLQFSGIYALTGYMVDVIEVRSMSYNPYLLAVISGAVQCIGVMSMTFILPRTGVKNLSILSTACVAFGMFVLGVSIMNANTSASSSPFANVVDWIHVISVWFTVLTASFGFIAIPYSILGEMFPMGAKSYASLSLIASSTFNFIVLKLHPLLFAGYGPLIYFIYAVIALSGTIFVSLFLPETVGKTLDEIKNRFRYSQDFNSQA